MTAEWIGILVTAAIGVGGIVVSYHVAKRSNSSTADQAEAERVENRRQRLEDRRQEAYGNLLRSVDEGFRVVPEVSRLSSAGAKFESESIDLVMSKSTAIQTAYAAVEVIATSGVSHAAHVMAEGALFSIRSAFDDGTVDVSLSPRRAFVEAIRSEQSHR